MRSEPVDIWGIAGTVVVEAPALGHPRVLVDGVPAPRITRAFYRLPTDDGEGVPVQVVGGPWMSPYPRLVLGDEVYETGPRPPWWLQLLALAPVLAPVVGGGFGFLATFFGIVGTWLVLRRPWSVAQHTAGVLAVVAATLALSWFVAHVLGWS